MVDIQSKEVIDKLSRDLKVQPAMQLPRELGKQIVPVFNVNPERLIKMAGATASDATSATVMTTSLVKDTFVVGAQLTVAKDVVSPATFSSLKFLPFGDSVKSVMFIRYEPLTAGQFLDSIEFTRPLKLERGTVVTVENNSGTASIDASGLIYFYEVDPQ